MLATSEAVTPARGSLAEALAVLVLVTLSRAPYSLSPARFEPLCTVHVGQRGSLCPASSSKVCGGGRDFGALPLPLP